eukprot:3492009-Amphidinium_carterae.1
METSKNGKRPFLKKVPLLQGWGIPWRELSKVLNGIQCAWIIDHADGRGRFQARWIKGGSLSMEVMRHVYAALRILCWGLFLCCIIPYFAVHPLAAVLGAIWM